MKIFSHSFMKDIAYTKYFNDGKICFLDIETTGFSRKYNKIYLIGIVFYDFEEDQWQLIQIFSQDENSEKAVLLELISYIKNFNQIITYNGDSFDIPFIHSRLDNYDIDFNLFSMENFDIYRLIKKNKHLLEYQDYKLKTVEENLGIFRDDIYTGGECIAFYKDYIKTKDPDLLSKILQHNYDDLFYLIDIIKIRDVIDKKRSLSFSRGKITIDDIVTLGDVLRINGRFYSEEKVKLIHYDSIYTIDIDGNNFSIELEYNIGFVSPDEKGFYVDKNEFALKNISISNANYKIPDSIILLQVEKRIFMDNIKNVVSHLVEKSMENLI